MVQVPEGQKLYKVTRRQVMIFETHVYARDKVEALAKLEYLTDNDSGDGFSPGDDCEDSVIVVKTPSEVPEYDITEVDLDDCEEEGAE